MAEWHPRVVEVGFVRLSEKWCGLVHDVREKGQRVTVGLGGVAAQARQRTTLDRRAIPGVLLQPISASERGA